MEHHLKIAPVHFAAVADGLKHAELRANDRPFKTGDNIILSEYHHQKGYTGESVNVVITHVCNVGFIAPGYVMLSIDLIRQ